MRDRPRARSAPQIASATGQRSLSPPRWCRRRRFERPWPPLGKPAARTGRLPPPARRPVARPEGLLGGRRSPPAAPIAVKAEPIGRRHVRGSSMGTRSGFKFEANAFPDGRTSPPERRTRRRRRCAPPSNARRRKKKPMKPKVPSRQVLEETVPAQPKRPARVGMTQAIAAQPPGAWRGYDAAEHRTGWRCLHTVSGFDQPALLVSEDPVVGDAIAMIDAWDDDPSARVGVAADARQQLPGAGRGTLFAGDPQAPTTAGVAPTVQDVPRRRRRRPPGARPGKTEAKAAVVLAAAEIHAASTRTSGSGCALPSLRPGERAANVAAWRLSRSRTAAGGRTLVRRSAPAPTPGRGVERGRAHDHPAARPPDRARPRVAPKEDRRRAGTGPRSGAESRACARPGAFGRCPPPRADRAWASPVRGSAVVADPRALSFVERGAGRGCARPARGDLRSLRH